MRIVRSSENLMQQTGQGDAHVFAPFDNSGLMNAIMIGKREEAAKRELKAKQEEDKKKELLEYYKYKGPNILDQHYVPSIQNKTHDYLNQVTEAYAKPGGPTDEDRMNFAQKKNEIEYEAQKRNGLKKKLDEDIKSIDQYPDYFDKEKIKAERIAQYHPPADENGNVDISQVNPDVPVENTAQYIKQPELYKTITNDVQKQIESGEYRSGEDIKGKETGSLFWKPEIGKNGKPTGNRVPGVSDTTIDFYLQHPDILMSATHSVDQKIDSDADKLKNMGDPRDVEVIKEDLSQDKDLLIRDHVKRQLENVNELTVKRSLRNASRKDGDDNAVTAEGTFIKTIAGLHQQTPEIVNGLPESNTLNANKVPYLDATGLFKGIKTGEGTGGKAIEPYKVLIDPEKPGTIFIQQTAGSPLTPMNDAAITQFVTSVGNIKANNLSYEKMMKEGGKLGVFGANNQFQGQNAVKANPAFNKEQQELSQAVSAEAINRGDKFIEAVNKNEGSWLTDWSETKKKEIEDEINNNVFKGASLVLQDGTVMKNPSVEIERGLFGGADYKVLDVSGNEKTFSKDELQSIAEGNADAGKLVISRETVKGNAKKNTSENKPKTVIQDGHTYTLNPETGEYE